MSDAPLRILILGAHPDDADYAAGGSAALYARAGHVVKMVSLTNGDAGHHVEPGPKLAARRKLEAKAAGDVIGIEYAVLDHHDGELQPTIANRNQLIGLIRAFRPDLILTHRPNDYHPDHRYTSLLVQDAAYMVTVPAVAPGTPHLKRNPVIAYLPDDFQRPYPLTPTIAVDVGPVFETILDMLQCHVSQFFEWLPYNMGVADRIPADAKGRRAWLSDWFAGKLRRQADRHRELLIRIYGEEHGRRIEFAEAFEPCEYGSPMDDEARRRLFPFLPWN
jgi:LmbE family N-acetylglucosaminyl deacetylase